MEKVVNFLVLIIRAILSFTRPLSEKVLDLLHCIIYGKSKPLPHIDNKILLMSATELAIKIRKKEITAAEVMQVYINRIKAVQPVINACIDSRFEEAMADARAVDKMLEAGIKTEAELAEEMPLLGVPFTCKEVIGVKNLISAWGLKKFKNRVAQEDSGAAAQYRLAGAIPVTVTNIPTYSLWWDADNLAFGRTKNPYDNHRTPGGSSGGEAALISSAGALIGIGNDLGGSIRCPASFCGIYGHKPSPGIIPIKYSFPLLPDTMPSSEIMGQYFVAGPMCRYAQDLNLLTKTLTGNNKKLRLDEQVDFRNVKVYYMEQLPGCLLSATSDIKASVRKAVKHFEEEYGITAHKLEIEEFRYAVDIWFSKLYQASGVLTNDILFNGAKPNFFWEFLKSTFRCSDYNFAMVYFSFLENQKKGKFHYKCLEMYDTIENRLEEILDENAILVLPVLPDPAPHPIVLVPKFGNVAYTCIFNVLRLPGTTIPSGLSNGLPIGLQVIAKRDCDRLTLAAAVELDKVFGGWRNPCPVLI